MVTNNNKYFGLVVQLSHDSQNSFLNALALFEVQNKKTNCLNMKNNKIHCRFYVITIE